MRDCFPVGAVRASLYLPLGYTKALGATVLRADYPRLVRLADEQELWTDDTANNPGLFGRGDGVTTFVLPNWSNRMMQLTSAGAGAALAAGLPNITGEFGIQSVTGVTSEQVSGAFKLGTAMSRAVSAETATSYRVAIDASRSSAVYGRSTTVQPPAIKMMPIMRY